MIEEMKEFSGIGETRRTLQYVTFFVIALFWVYEGYRTFALYRFSLMGWGFNVLFLLLYLWRTAFSYTYTLTPSHFIIIMYGLGIERRLSISLRDMESFSNHYKKSFFRKTKIGSYTHRYSSLDPNPQRILVYRKGKKLCGLLFKCSDRMIAELARRYPSQFLDFGA